MASSTPRQCSAAQLRMSWLIRVEQNLGPHMENWAVLATLSHGGVGVWTLSIAIAPGDYFSRRRTRPHTFRTFCSHRAGFRFDSMATRANASYPMTMESWRRTIG